MTLILRRQYRSLQTPVLTQTTQSLQKPWKNGRDIIWIPLFRSSCRSSRKLDALAKSRTEDGSLAIIDQNQVVHMAHMDIHFSHSTNGVATLHTQILKESELAGFYHLYPEKFNNKTNGITFRRWLLKCNPSLTNEIESLIGNGFKKDASELKKLLAYTNDQNVPQETF